MRVYAPQLTRPETRERARTCDNASKLRESDPGGTELRTCREHGMHVVIRSPCSPKPASGVPTDIASSCCLTPIPRLVCSPESSSESVNRFPALLSTFFTRLLVLAYLTTDFQDITNAAGC